MLVSYESGLPSLAYKCYLQEDKEALLEAEDARRFGFGS
jgi:hypothetical protein